MKINQTIKWSIHTLVNIVLAVGFLYLFELYQPVTSYFSYYGNVTTANIFIYPESISSYSFGYAKRQPIKLDFINSLWCREANNIKYFDLIDTQYNTIDNFLFYNKLPQIDLIPLGTEKSIQSISVDDMQRIRDDVALLSWDMGTIAPNYDAVCRITANITAYTTVFKIPKTIEFEGNQFAYKISQ